MTEQTEHKLTVEDIITDIDYRLNHIEDIMMDNRELIIKLVKQGNTIVQFLRQIDVDGITEEDIMDMEQATEFVTGEINAGKFKDVHELIDEYTKKYKELQEFEKELEKNKNKLTPGQMGES